MRLKQPTRLDTGIFLTSFAVLLVELLLTRIFSVTLFYHLSFMVVSLAMLGFAAAGLVVHLWPSRFPEERLHDQLSVLGIAFAISTVVAISIAFQVSVSLYASAGNLFRLAFIYSFCVIPFFLGGFIVALLMTHRTEIANRLYAFDLIGAALACLAFIPLTNYVGAPTAVLVGALTGAIAAAIFSWRQSTRLTQLALGVSVLLVVGAVANSYWNFLDVQTVKGRTQPPTIALKWNSFSRVEVIVQGDPPDMWAPRPARHAGLSTKLDPSFRLPELYMRYDADAATTILRFDGDLSKLWFLDYDVTAAPYQLRKFQNVLVLGPGGGRDVLTALLLGSQPVTGVEINPLAINLMKNEFRTFTGGLYDNYPGVRVIHDEGRSFLRKQSGQYDLIQASLVDTWAASAAGAYALTENNLYTVEAFDEYLNHLTPDGVIAFSRWYPTPPVEPLRVATLAVESLRRKNVANPADHVFVLRTNHPNINRILATILIKQSPFTPDELAKLRAWSDRMDFIISYSPDDAARGAAPNDFHRLLSFEYENVVANYPYDISPVYDDKPFFFDRVPLVPWLSHRLGVARTRLGEGNLTLGVRTLLLSLLISAGFTLLLLLVPALVALVRSRRKSEAGTSVPWPRLVLWALYFSCLGLGFITVEIVMIQRLNLFLGYPVYSLSVVLFTLLFFSGIGSLTASTWNDPRKLKLTLAILGLVLIAFSVCLEPILHALLGASPGVRIFVAGALLAPAGFLMGIPFPTGLRLAGAETKSLVSWAWAVNGGASVFGSSLIMVSSMTYGFALSSLVGVAAYVVAFILIVALTRSRTATPASALAS